jgi:pimeloyl-ACP methyl ester carboxylesterase
MALTHKKSEFALDHPPTDFRPEETSLLTVDGETISAGWAPGRSGAAPGLAFVLAHGFTGSWREPRVQAVQAHLSKFGDVLSIDQRGHGRSTGLCTVGMDEVLDVDAAVGHVRTHTGARSVITVGFSMGGSVVLRQGALAPGSIHAPEHRPDAVVSVSAPGFWFYRGTKVMRVVHRLIENPAGRAVLRSRGVRLTSTPWPEPPPWSPEDSVRRMGDFPLLVVHGDIDHYFPVEHARVLERAAEEAGNTRAEVIIVPGFAHAESTVDLQTMDRIGKWATGQLSL